VKQAHVLIQVELPHPESQAQSNRLLTRKSHPRSLHLVTFRKYEGKIALRQW
jgi:hypothetical protein